MDEKCKLLLNNEMVEVDFYLIPILNKLNECGYKTLYSCSSHPEKEKYNGYILIEYSDKILDILKDVIFDLPISGSDYVFPSIHISNNSIHGKLIALRFRTNKNNFNKVLELFDIIIKKIDDRCTLHERGMLSIR